MQCSCLQITAFVVLLAGTILIAISIGTPNWSHKDLTLQGNGLMIDQGLWKTCHRRFAAGKQLDQESHGGCDDRIQNTMKKLEQLRTGDDISNFIEKEMKTWDVAVLVLMCSSALFGILSLVFSPCCCNRCGCCLAVFVFFAASFCAAGVCTYVYYMTTDSDMNFWNDLAKTVNMNSKQFGYSFWCAVAGGGLQLISGIMFAVSRCRQHSYSHTI